MMTAVQAMDTRADIDSRTDFSPNLAWRQSVTLWLEGCICATCHAQIAFTARGRLTVEHGEAEARRG